ncbi:MAG: site-specific integrase [Actinomycetota bacterium]|nr:site-specific integrase [Actinomycetota bacterium]
MRDDEQYPLWLLLASTGMRRGEALGLPWRDLDLDAGRLAVRQSLLCIDGNPRIEEPKSRYSIRTIDLDRSTVAALQQRRAQQGHDRRPAGKYWTDNGLVFTRDDGVWLNPDWMSERFRLLSEDAGVPSIRMHDLRHTHATLLLRQGINVKVVSERLGHHSVAFTLDTHAHVVPGMQREAANAFGNLLPDLSQPDDDDDDDGTAGVTAMA